MLIALILFVAFGSAGCITVNKKTTTTPATQGGFFISEDQGETWTNKSLLMTPSGTPGNIAETDVYVMRFDPSDNETMYAGTRADGLYYSYNGGAGWTKAKTLKPGFVRDIAIDSKNKCVLYAAVETTLYKSEDCARNWKSIWYSDAPDKKVAAIELDWYDPRIVYAGNTDGTMIKSEDGGVSWKVANAFKARVNKIVVDPNDSRIVYVGVLTKGLYKSIDKGVTWESLNKQMKDFTGSANLYDFSVAKNKKNMIAYASKFGMLKSLDGGTTWSEVKLLSKVGTEEIFSMAVDQNNADYIYYGTDKAFYKSLDGGATWIVKKMPTTRVAGELLIHPKTASKIFMGVKTLEQK